jgi:DNA-binding TFAR19-related protein (PDSD5 family)
MRRIREYIQEQEQPLTDDVIAQDVLGGRPGTPEFESLRFAVNFRLSREHRDFDFVGTANQRFWSVNTLAQLGTTRKKPNEIGADYRHLIDEVGESPAYRSRQSLDRVLTFYEYQLGLLPYDLEMAELLPAPLLPNQRTAVLTFECPQSYTTYLVELRYPSPNRGGFIVGLDDFYNENLVPGALITLSRTDNDGHYIVTYVPAETQNARLLELEDRRQRYVFRPATYACGVIDEQVLTEERYPALAQEKPMEEKARRRLENVIMVAFERIARPLESGTGFAATFDELFAISNIERPITESQLRTILDTDESGAFSRDPDVQDGYTYVPSTN